MNVEWNSETTKIIGEFISKEIVDQDLEGVTIWKLSHFHRNTLRNVILGKQSITFESVIKPLLALEESLDALFLDLFPNRIIGLKKETKKVRYIKSIVHYIKKQSISKEEFNKLIGQYWEETT